MDHIGRALDDFEKRMNESIDKAVEEWGEDLKQRLGKEIDMVFLYPSIMIGAFGLILLLMSR